MKITIPDQISIVRLFMSAVMLLATGFKMPNVFLGAFGVSLITDFLDGYLARRLHQESKLGAILDTCGDVTMYIAAALGGWFLWPDLMRQEAVFVIMALSFVFVSALLSLLKHRKLPSYHTWTTKFASAAIGVSLLIMYLDWSAIPFRLSVVALIISSLEEMAITLILPSWRPDVRSIFAAVQYRREMQKSS